MAKKQCGKEVTLDMENYDLFLESDERFLTLTCDRRRGHKRKHTDKIYGLSWSDDIGSPMVEGSSYE